MIVESVQQETKLQERLIRAYIRGCDERTIELRGYGLTTDERDGVEAEARELYA